MYPGFADPAVASVPPAGNLYFQADQAVAAKSPGEQLAENLKEPALRSNVYDVDGQVGPSLMFGAGVMTGEGQPIVSAANQTSGHWSEVLNFHGSPAPWVLIGILIVAGVLHLSGGGKLGAKVNL